MAKPAKSSAATSPAIAIVGAGKCGATLAWALHAAGLPVTEIVVGRAATATQMRLARDLGATLTRFSTWRSTAARVLWLCVGDDEIQATATQLAAQMGTQLHGKIILHTSAGRSYLELAALKRNGAYIGAAHPARSFPLAQRISLAGTYFAIEGDRPAQRAARAMVKAMGGRPFALRAGDKTRYHAACVLASGLVVSHLAAAEELVGSAGAPKAIAHDLIAGLAGGTFANWRQNGAAKSFTGPVARGDFETLARHLASLSGMSGPEAIYRALTKHALEHLPASNPRRMQAMMRRKR